MEGVPKVMHPSCISNAEKFINKYLDPFKPLKILDVGSFNVNGTLRPLFTYQGCICGTCGACCSVSKLEPMVKCCGKEMIRDYVCDGIGWRPHKVEKIGANWRYIGMDLKESCKPYGEDITQIEKDPVLRKFNVDLMTEDPYRFPIQDSRVDVVMSTSCLEHDMFFWETFKEMVRVVCSGGFIYLNVPSSGPYHGYPLDCWRFQKDSYLALSKWLPQAELLESYIEPDSKLHGGWADCIGIFKVNKAK